MTIVPSPDIQPCWLLEWEVGLRIDELVWTQQSSPYANCWGLPTAAAPSRLRETGQRTAKKNSLAECQATTGTWWWDTGVLYVHTSADDTPANHIYLSHNWEYFASHSPITFNGHDYLPILSADSIQQVTTGCSPYHEGGMKQSFGAVKLLNGDGYFDARLSAYIYEGKYMRLLQGEIDHMENDVVVPKPYDTFRVYWEGWSGNIDWAEDAITVGTTDIRRTML